MTVRVAMNRSGRIGGNILRTVVDVYREDIEVFAINDLASVETNAQLRHQDLASEGDLMEGTRHERCARMHRQCHHEGKGPLPAAGIREHRMGHTAAQRESIGLGEDGPTNQPQWRWANAPERLAASRLFSKKSKRLAISLAKKASSAAHRPHRAERFGDAGEKLANGEQRRHAPLRRWGRIEGCFMFCAISESKIASLLGTGP